MTRAYRLTRAVVRAVFFLAATGVLAAGFVALHAIPALLVWRVLGE